MDQKCQEQDDDEQKKEESLEHKYMYHIPYKKSCSTSTMLRSRAFSYVLSVVQPTVMYVFIKESFVYLLVRESPQPLSTHTL